MSSKALDPLTLPPLPKIDPIVELGPSLRQAFQELCDGLFQASLAHYERHKAVWAQAVEPRLLSEGRVAAAFDYFQKGKGKVDGGPHPQLPADLTFGVDTRGSLPRLLQHPELPPVSMIRVLAWAGHFRPVRSGDGYHPYFSAAFESLVRHYWQHHDIGRAVGLRELAATLEAAGFDGDVVGRARLLLLHMWPAFVWDPAATWPYFADRPHLLEEALDLKPGLANGGVEDYWQRYTRPRRRKAAFDILAMFPRLPDRFVEPCWSAALGSAKNERSWGQRALESAADTESRLLAALSNGKQDIRCAAAEWLGQRRSPAAAQPLKKALAREKQDVVKGAFMGALERLGVPVDQFLNRPDLVQQAQKGLQKGVPEDLGWFPLSTLPAVHWSDSGEAVPSEVVTWFLVQSCKLKNAEPSALLRRYASYFNRAEAAELGWFILSAWIAQDTRLPSEEDAKNHAQQLFAQWGGMPGATLQQFVQNTMQTPLGSAVAQKGILALASACGDGRAAQAVEAYLRTWYGQRAAQCKALLQMLAWVDHPAAIQLLLATAKRFRTPGIRKEAERLVQVLAERRGWTVAELADRTIPTCGLNDKGELILDYGERRFIARLSDDLELILTADDGKKIASLPEPRKSEDAELVKQTKKQWTAVKKELKSLLKQQNERFYEAMCTQRTWSVADWRTFLLGHPIVNRLCQRLVWAVLKDDVLLSTFRPLGDGTLTDAEDKPVELPDDAGVRVAHTSFVPAAVAERWQQHLADYEVPALFPQFGQPAYELSEEKKRTTDIDDFLGHLIEAFKLRGRATKRGYVRGSAEDGGWFHSYKKQFPTLELEVVLEFSGNSLPEENRVVALQRMYFLRTARTHADTGVFASVFAALSGAETPYMPLGEVPAVLVSECWNDLRTIAADGSGFDPDWEKKVNR